MGLLDDYKVDLDEFEAFSFDVPDDIYEFTVGEAGLVEGTSKNPEALNFVIKYLLENENGKVFNYNEYIRMPDDFNNLTEDDKKKLGRLKTRLLQLGVPDDQLNTVDGDDLVGIYGTFQLSSRKGKNGNVYQNLRNMRVEEGGKPDDEPAPAPIVKKPAATRKPRAAKPKVEPVAEPETTEEPETAAEAVDEAGEAVETDDEIKARIAAKRAERTAAANTSGRRPNPFGKKA
jgi:hypothetical protein